MDYQHRNRKRRKMTLTNALQKAAGEAYQNEVIDTLMKESLIGEGKEFDSKESWIEAKIDEWMEG